MKVFEKSSVFVLADGEYANKVFRIEVDDDTQKAICQSFSNATENMTTDKDRIEFNGSYKPIDNEFLAIRNFEISDEIKKAIRNPLGTASFKKQKGEFPDIKSVFVGECYKIETSESFNIAFQRFRKEQYISTNRFNLFFEKNTFFRQNSFGISISDNIDCYYTGGELQFESFFFARQVFDLARYYRSATDHEVTVFASNERLKIENIEAFEKMADTWIRRKVAMINDSGVLNDYSVSEVIQRAKEIGLIINKENSRIVLPNDKKRVKEILGFLDEEVYKGPFSMTTFLAGSKRRIDNSRKKLF